MILDISIYLVSFLVIWFGAGLIVNGVSELSHKLNISSFAASFFVLGILTSIPEASVGINSIINADPQIFVGNLIGASLVLFVLAIPILSIFGNGIKLAHALNSRILLFSLFIIALPTFLIIDKKITVYEGWLLIALYPVLFYMIEKKKGLLKKIRDKISGGKTHILMDMAKMAGGTIIVFISSSIIVDKTIYFSGFFHISPFLISLLVLSVGTNLPELALAIKSLSLGKKEIALGDYVGSAAANTLFFGILTVANGREIILANHLLITFIFMGLGLSVFFFFSRSKNDISRREGIILLLIYLAFVLVEGLG